MKHSPEFLKLTRDAKKQIREVRASPIIKEMKRGGDLVLVDIREDHEWEKGHAAGAIHLGRGILERDIEKTIPAKEKKIVLYCGGGYRSALAAANLGKMGYQNVFSLRGGWHAWKRTRGPVDTKSGLHQDTPGDHHQEYE